MTCASKMQTETALNTTEAEFIALIGGLRSVIPLKRLSEEMHKMGVGIVNRQTEIRCKVFEDNSGASTVTTLPKIRPRTKFQGACRTGKGDNPSYIAKGTNF